MACLIVLLFIVVLFYFNKLLVNNFFLFTNFVYLSLGMALSCKETFSLLYYEHDGSNKEAPPPWEPDSYKLIDRIAADEGRSTSNSEVSSLFFIGCFYLSLLRVVSCSLGAETNR